ncbi:MAG: ABC transporter substrate-binding protein, partial [Alphaproteobacteria bacterium]|nr:ABC transporter substrate-binding protein [Alphaproteobacteria bacterium]
MALQAAGRRALVTAVATAACLAAVAVAAEPRHGLSAFGDLKYGADFTHFAYVEPGAPKGGTVRLQDEGSFDNLNPFILKGIKLAGMGAQALRLPFESLMTRAQDEPDAMYGLVAESADLAADRSAVAFTVRGQARWHDGTPITANDVAFSAATLRAEGDPAYRLVLRDV